MGGSVGLSSMLDAFPVVEMPCELLAILVAKSSDLNLTKRPCKGHSRITSIGTFCHAEYLALLPSILMAHIRELPRRLGIL